MVDKRDRVERRPYGNAQAAFQSGDPLRKRFRVVRLLLLATVFSLAGGLLFVFSSDKVYVTPSHVIIKHVFETRISMNDIEAIQERINARGVLRGTRFYCLGTKGGFYNIEDKDFLDKEGAQIVRQLGFVKQECNYLNIRHVWCSPSSSGTYCYGPFVRALSADSIFIYSWLWLAWARLWWFLSDTFMCIRRTGSTCTSLTPTAAPTRSHRSGWFVP